jgi:hypothetical protein
LPFTIPILVTTRLRYYLLYVGIVVFLKRRTQPKIGGIPLAAQEVRGGPNYLSNQSNNHGVTVTERVRETDEILEIRLEDALSCRHHVELFNPDNMSEDHIMTNFEAFIMIVKVRIKLCFALNPLSRISKLRF